MDFIRDLILILIPISIFVSLIAGLYQLASYRNVMARWSGLVLLSIFGNLICYFLLYTGLFPEAGRILIVIQVFSYLLLDISYVVFAIYFSGHPKWITNLLMTLITLLPVFVIFQMLLQWDTLPFSLGVNEAGFGISSPLKFLQGGYAWFFVGFSNAVGIFSLGMFIWMLFNSPKYYRNAVLVLIFGTMIVAVSALCEMAGANPLKGISILQSAVALNTIPIYLIVFRWRAVGSIAITQQLFKDTMRDGYLIVDSQNNVVDFNRAVQNLLGDRPKIEIGSQLSELFPTFDFAINPGKNKNFTPLGPILFKSQNFISEIMVYPLQSSSRDISGRMVVFHNVSDRDHLEDTLRKNNIELSRSNAYFSSLARLALSLQTAHDFQVVLDTLGKELHHLGLKCFVALLNSDSDELEVRLFSEGDETIRTVEKIFGKKIYGFGLNRAHFFSLYEILETRQIHYFHNEESGLAVFLGNLPGWIMDPLINASAVTRNEPSALIPLIAVEKVIGIMGVWGSNLEEADVAPFQIFGSQVGWAIEKANLQAIEVQRLEELSHSNTMITALSTISSQVETTPDTQSAFISLGDELGKIGLNCAVVTLDDLKETATIRYITFQSDALEKIEHLTGITLLGHQIPKKYWPGEKATHEGQPVWYGDPEKIFQQLFPEIPERMLKKVYQLLKGVQTGQLCMLPLKVSGKIIGILLIWGQNLSPRDSLTLSVFSDQVAAILRRNVNYENEMRKSGEIARSNSMILALSGVASQLGNTTDLNQVLETLGAELKKVNLNCMVGTLDQDQQSMKVEYLTIGNEMIKAAQKIGILIPNELRIPRRLWPTQKAVTEKAPYWDPNPIGNSYQMFPFIPKDIYTNALRLVGLDLSEPVCYLPMIDQEEVIGILAVWGKELAPGDIPALTIFANQVTSAISNTLLYMKAQNEIIERTQAEARIRETLSEKEVLIKEVHHRVKNNLQVISSLLNLQAVEISDENTRIALRESQNRVRTMALIHEKLYQSNDLAHIDFSTYLQSLVSSLAQSYRVRMDRVEIQVQVEKVLLDLDTAIPCGLIVNELVSNSIKYAFPDDGFGKIQIICGSHTQNRYSLVVCDDGIGLPPGFDYARSTSLGLKLVNSLIRQIDGEIKVESRSGTRFEIMFAKPEV
jgi:two-component sensor histidine kinase